MQTVPLTDKQRAELEHLNMAFGATVTRSQLLHHYKKQFNNGVLPRWLMTDPLYKAGRGLYHTVAQSGGTTKLDPTKPFPKFKNTKNTTATLPQLPVKKEVVLIEPHKEDAVIENAAQVIPLHREEPKTGPHIQIGDDLNNVGALVPEIDSTFVPFGVYDDILKLIRKGIFYPVYITGLTGNGKTMLVEQACAIARRELVRIQITPETDEDDLIGGFRLVNGETVWFDGPVILAAKRGAIVLIDEIDYGTGKISCLQGIMEGKGIFLKKVNRIVYPEPGFNIIATANTKGRGSEEFGGRYINTQIMNEAFLERFGVTFEQEYPSVKTEIKILQKVLYSLNLNNDLYATNLANWADVTRKAFYNGGSEDYITTRRLVHIIRAYAVFENEKNAISKCLARFSKETAEGFLQLFEKVAIENTPQPDPAAVTANLELNGVMDPNAVIQVMTPAEAFCSSNANITTTAIDSFNQARIDCRILVDPDVDPLNVLEKDPSIMKAFVELMRTKGYFINGNN
jgi:MoxR-like ATPase